jgi:hypothetical protein
MRDIVKFSTLALLASVSLAGGSTSQAAAIILVTNAPATEAPLIAHLTGTLGHTVTTGTYSALDTNATQVAELNAADLVIVSRNGNSGDYASNATEVAAWDAITTPLLLGNGFVARANRWNWVGPNLAPDMQENYGFDISAPTGTLSIHPFFAGALTNEDHLNGGVGSPPISGLEKYRPSTSTDIPNGGTALGDGVVIGVRNNASFQNVYLASWAEGELTGSGNLLGCKRVFYALPETFASFQPAGITILDNVVGSLLVPEPATYLTVIPALMGLIYLKRRT